MPCDYKKYPKNWKEIRQDILKRADNRCELCGVPNNEFIIRFQNGPTWTYDYYICEGLLKCDKRVKIILTIHHIDADINNNDYSNLIALCQRCHLRLDLPFKLKKRKLKNANKSNK